jgi:xanthine dehydrogenase YagR molybdenum-binding subunit
MPHAFIAGGSAGTASWGTTILQACDAFRQRADEEHSGTAPEGMEVTTDLVTDHAGPLPGLPFVERFAMQAYGAQFAEVEVREDSGEIRVRRLLGMFDIGRVINPKLARSQLLGGMTWGLSMALHEHSVLDPHTGHIVHWLAKPDWGVPRILDRSSRLRGSICARATPEVQSAVQG